MVMVFYHNRLDLWRINQAYITLIPKSTTPETLSDYRPISVLSVVPKILTKILATRLQPYLHGMISNNQTTFIKGRQLMQTFLSTRELPCHLVKNKISSIFMKIDFQKAFDSISWDFLLEVLRVRGFPPLWIVWMRSLLISSTSFLKINGLKGQSFYHRKGLRQGGPLSPLLFILAEDSLQAMINKIRDKLIDLPMARTILLQFADDTAIVTPTHAKNIKLIMATLKTFA
jgi:Reverse transcriptase (RNA-dependent DNA polymerase)